jgi:hypothetical protein
MDDETLLHSFIPLISKLATKDWYTARSAAACLISLIFPRLINSVREDLFIIFAKLANDETASVRKAVAKSLAGIVRVSPLNIQSSLLEILKSLARDEQDSIRIHIIPACTVFASFLSTDLKVSLPLIHTILLFIYLFFVYIYNILHIVY